MKINEVEAAVGVTKKNIRFYEEEGLIRPGREPGNGYRSYSQADVERLRRIKLLRKLDVPLADIREMLEGQRTLAEGMAQQLERLSTRRKDLDEAIGFCTLLQQENGPLEQLDVQQTLARLTAREEQGVTFVNIERTDRKTERIRGACIGAAIFVALMAFVIATMAWAFYHGLGSLHRPAGCPAAAAAHCAVRHPVRMHHRHAEGAHRPDRRDRKGRRRCLS